MHVSPLAGKPAVPAMLVNLPRLVTAYYTERPDPTVRAHQVAFGTSGHRGSAFKHAFNEAHILAISQAICLYRGNTTSEEAQTLIAQTFAAGGPTVSR